MGSMPPNLSAAGTQVFIFKQIHVCVLASSNLTQITWQELEPILEARDVLWTLHHQHFGENVALCRAGQQIPGIEEFSPCQSGAPGVPCSCREESRTMGAQFCSDTSDKTLHFFSWYIFLPCSVLVLPDLCEIPHFPCLP